MLRVAPVVCGALIIGALGAVIAFGARGGNESFRAVQTHGLSESVSTVLTGPNVAKAISTAPEPVAAPLRTPVVKAVCLSKGKGALPNPWECTLRYRSGTVAHYLVAVQPDGAYSGIGTGFISGCCVKVPTLNR